MSAGHEIQQRSIKIIFGDIDGTQLDESIRRSQYPPAYLQDVATLKAEFERVRKEGVKIVHATNRMWKLVEKDLDILSPADYITCSASTRVMQWNPRSQKYEDATDYNALVESCEFHVERCHEQARRYSELVLTSAENQTGRKVSYIFAAETPLARRHEIHDALQAIQPKGIKVFMVEDRDNHIIDFLPAFCTKAAVIDFILRKEGLSPDEGLAIGNSNNDLPMLEAVNHAVAVKDARDSLKNVIVKRLAEGKDNWIANHPHTQGVIQAIKHYCPQIA